MTSAKLRMLSLPLVAVAITLVLAFGARGQSSPLRLSLLVSTSPDRANPVALRGLAPFGTLYPFLKVTGDGAVVRVRYQLDGKPIATTRRSPYPSRPIRATELAHGAHVLEARAVVKGGHERVLRARFTSSRRFVAPAAAGTTCTQASPCGLLQRAYDVAAPGQVVEVAGGDYGEQAITGTKQAPGVTFLLPAGDAAARLELRASYITFHGPMRLGWTAYREAQHLTFRGVKHEGYFGIWSADHVALIGGESYCDRPDFYCDYDPAITEDPGSRDPPTDILIDGVSFHDWGKPAGSDWHTECLQAGAGIRVRIRRSSFRRCATHGVFVRSWGNTNGGIHPLEDWAFENNFFDKSTGGYYAVQFIGDLTPNCNNVRFRYNTARESFRKEACRDLRYVGNVAVRFSFMDCDGAFSHNVWFAPGGRPAKCSATDKAVVDPGLLNAAAGDLRLRPDSRAINAGDPKDFPAVDIQGQRRPKGRAPDAGADEAR